MSDGVFRFGAIVAACYLCVAMSVGQAQATESSDAFFQHSLAKLGEIPGFQCRFEQRMQFSDGGSQQYSGELAVRKPGMFRWQYKLPYDQLYVGDGKVIWHYEPDLMQAEKLADLEAVDPVVMRLLDGRLALKDITIVEYKLDTKNQLRRYLVELAADSRVWLAFLQDGSLRYIERDDVLGNTNRMQFSECAYIAPSKNLFSFSPPADVDVLDILAKP